MGISAMSGPHDGLVQLLDHTSDESTRWRGCEVRHDSAAMEGHVCQDCLLEAAGAGPIKPVREIWQGGRINVWED